MSNISILDVRKFKDKDNSREIDIALPVYAFECEVKAPVDRELDAYQESALKFIAVGIKKNGIAKTLDISQNMTENLLVKLRQTKRIDEKDNITQFGKEYLNNIETEEVSETSEYGYMFMSSIKKDILPYFYKGDIGNLPFSRPELLGNKLTKEHSEDKTFASPSRRSQLFKFAYKNQYLKLQKMREKKTDDGEEPLNYDYLFEGLDDDFEEADYTDNPPDNSVQVKNTDAQVDGSKATYVRLLEREPQKIYLHLRVILDQTLPEGFNVQSPFADLKETDAGFYVRQILWLKNREHSVYLGNKFLDDVLNSEISKLRPSRRILNESFEVFLIRELPALSRNKEKLDKIYGDLNSVFDMMNRGNFDMLSKESVVKALHSKLLERSLSILIKKTSSSDRVRIKREALNDLSFNKGIVEDRICQMAGINRGVLPRKDFSESVKRLDDNLGNSVIEKFVNVFIINYYYGEYSIKQLIESPTFPDTIDKLKKLNRIRNRASHSDDSSNEFTDADYEDYRSNVFAVANNIISVLLSKE
jgi:hypothetical protein